MFNLFRTPYLDVDDGVNLGGSDDVILPDDFMPETKEEAELQTEDTTSTDPEITAEQPRFKVKYNHEEKELGYDEAVPLIQKGMNYDKLQQQFNTIQNDPRLSKADRIAQVSQMLGYQTDDELLDALYNTYYETTAQKNNSSPDLERARHELQREKETINKEKQTMEQQKQRNSMYERLFQNFPNIKVEEIKPETWTKVHNGMDLTAAYVEQRNQELEAKVKILTQNSKNEKKAPVNGATTHGGDNPTGQDPFEMGFDSIK